VACHRRATAYDDLALASQAEARVDWPTVATRLPWRAAKPPVPWRGGRWIAVGLAVGAACLGTMRGSSRTTPDLIVAPLAPPATDTVPARVTAVAGRVRARRGGAWDELGAGEPLRAGGHLVTENGQISLQLEGATGVVLGAHSELALSGLSPDAEILDLNRGHIGLQVQHRRAGQIFRVTTPGHSIEVRGTRFEVEREAGRTIVTVCEGAVAVRAREGTGEHRVEHGQRAMFRDGNIHPASTRPAPARCLLPWLQAGDGLVHISGARAEITFAGVTLGPVPVALDAPSGRHRLELAREGVRQVRWIDVKPGEQSVEVPALDLSPRAREIGAAVSTHSDEVRMCYERGLKRNPDLEGTPKLALRVQADGHVQRADLVASDLTDHDVEACIAGAAQRWVFPPGPPIRFLAVLALRPRQ
jgi:hypothetical protein